MDFHFDNTPAPSSQRPVRVRRIARGTNMISHAEGVRGNINVFTISIIQVTGYYRSFSSSSCRLKWTAVIKAVKGTKPAKVTISIILPPAQCIILNNSAKLNKLMVVAPNL